MNSNIPPLSMVLAATVVHWCILDISDINTPLFVGVYDCGDCAGTAMAHLSTHHPSRLYATFMAIGLHQGSTMMVSCGAAKAAIHAPDNDSSLN